MPTVVDSFVVELELDPKKFDSGRRQAEENFDKTKQKAVSTAKGVEEAMQKTGETVGAVKTQVLGLFAAFTGLGAAAFVQQMVHADASTGRAAKTINMATGELGAWEGAAQLAGAKLGELTGGFAGLTNALKTAELTGDASLGSKFRQLFDIDVAGPNGLKTAAELYLEIAKKAEGMDPAKATTAMSILGVPAGVIPLLLQGGDAVKKLLGTMREVGTVADENAAAAVRFESAWVRAFKMIQNAARPLYGVGTAIADAVTYALNPENRSTIGDLNAKNSEVSKLFWMRGSKGSKSYGAWEKANAELEAMEAANAARSKAQSTESQVNSMNQVGQGAANPAGGAFKDNAEKEAYIRAEAKRLNVDPDQAMRVAKSEGFYNFRSTVTQRDGSKEPSFGAFQLYTGGGLGNVFQKKTGLDPSDPANEKATISFALQHAATSGNGWKDWHGWKGAQYAGLPGPGTGAAAGGNQTTTVTIGKIDVVTQAKDAGGIAADLGGAIRRDMTAQQSNAGPQ